MRRLVHKKYHKM